MNNPLSHTIEEIEREARQWFKCSKHVNWSGPITCDACIFGSQIPKFLRASLRRVLEGVRGESEILKCKVPPEPYGNIKNLSRSFVDKLLLYVGRFNYNKAISDISSLIEGEMEKLK